MKKDILTFLLYIGGLAIAVLAMFFSDVGVFSIIHLVLGVCGCLIVIVSVLNLVEKYQQKYNLPNLYTYCIFIFLCICIYASAELLLL